MTDGETARIAIFDDESGRVLDLPDDRQAAQVQRAEKQDRPPRRGRPRLGVVSREVSLLPRHWQWLAEQRGGASASLRRLVENAQKNESGQAIATRAIDAAHRFIWDIAGDQPDFEEATRHLFAFRLDEFEQATASWPVAIREQLARYLARARTGLAEQSH
jgi:uncharacterized protein